MKRGWIVIAAMLAACNGSSLVTPRVTTVLDDTFALRVGQQAVFGSEPLRLTFKEVSEDSRCPLRAQCVWAGNARVRLEVSVPFEGAQVVELNTNTSVGPQVASAFGYSIRLERLEPYPEGGRIPQNEYLAYLTVSRK